MTDKIGLQRLYWELALMGLEWETAVKVVIKSQIGDGQPVPIPGTSRTVTRHNEGFAVDFRYSIGDAEPVTITWVMQTEEWDRLRNYLRHDPRSGKAPDVLDRLAANGGLEATSGTLRATTTPYSGPPTAVKYHNVKPLDSTSDLWKCACGTTFHNDHGWAICPNEPKADA